MVICANPATPVQKQLVKGMGILKVATSRGIGPVAPPAFSTLLDSVALSVAAMASSTTDTRSVQSCTIFPYESSRRP